MIFKVDDSVDINGTHLQGHITTTRKHIQSVFGKPTYRGDRWEKVTCEWDIEFDDGLIATIYDYKRYEDGSPKMDEEYDWHIGGHDPKVVEHVKACLGEWALV